MIMKCVYIIFLTIFSFSYNGECTSNPLENVKFLTKLELKASGDWETDLVEPEDLQNEKSYLTRPQDHEDLKYDQDINNKETLLGNEEKEIGEYELEDLKVESNKRVVRQANTGYSNIYPTLTPQHPNYPTPYRPATGVHGNHPYNYTNQNNYNPSPSHYYQTSTPPSYYPRPPPQNPFLNNSSYSNPGYYNQGSFNSYNQSNTNPYNNKPYPQYNQNSNQRYNSSIGQYNQFNNHPSANSSYPPFQGNFQQYGNNANQHGFVPTPSNNWTPGNANNNNAPYNAQGVTSNYPKYNTPNSIPSYSTPRSVLNPIYPTPSNRYPPYNSPNPSHQTYPLYNTTRSQHNYNSSNQWSSGTQNQYPGGNYPTYIPTDGRFSNASRFPANYPSLNPSSYPTQKPYSPSAPNPYPNYYPSAPNSNVNNIYSKEPDHFFYAPSNQNPRNPYDLRNNPSSSF